MGGAHKKSPVIDHNPFGEIPILEDGDVCLRDSQAILVYLARKYGGESWLPTDPASMARVDGMAYGRRERGRRVARATPGSMTSSA